MKWFKLIENGVEALGWIRIALSPFLIASGIGLSIWFALPSGFTEILFIVLSVLGLLAGIILANRKRKSGGTINFLSQINSSPEPDKETEHKT